jgi:hypothetical protein
MKRLTIGDVIVLKDGMKVYTDIPQMFVYSNRMLDKTITNSDVVIGKIYQNDLDIKPMIKNIAERIKDAFGSEGVDLNISDAIGFVNNIIKQPNAETFILKGGEFVVFHTSIEEGGIGMGPHDVYPNGYKVYCKPLVNGLIDVGGPVVSFYQTGCFTAMIENIEPINNINFINKPTTDQIEK